MVSFSSPVSVAFLVILAALADAKVTPSVFRGSAVVGDTLHVKKTIQIDGFHESADVCLVQDATGSFFDDCPNLIAQIPAITALFSGFSSAHFGLSSFKDYTDGSDVYKSLLTMGSAADLLSAVTTLCSSGIGGGYDYLEAQYDAIVKAASSETGGCGWRPNTVRIMIGVTDAGCHVPADGPSYQNDEASTIAALTAQNIIFIGLATGTHAANCFGPLASATGGMLEPLSSTSSDIATAIEDALDSIKYIIDPTFSEECSGLDINFSPSFPVELSSGETYSFLEEITVLPPCEESKGCKIKFGLAGTQSIEISSSCAKCGNGVLEAGEQCDPPLAPSCTKECQCACGYNFSPTSKACVPQCGDLIVQGGEECDGTPGCNEKCVCDRGYVAYMGQCRCVGLTCAGENKCGDGKVQAPEECDGTQHCTESCQCVGGYVSVKGICRCSSKWCLTYPMLAEEAIAVDSGELTAHK